MIIIFGPAGAGKTVQGKLLATAKNWQWLSAGQLLRDSNMPELSAIINNGDLVPTEAVNKVITEAFNQSSNMDHIVLDGFPRQSEEAEWLLEESSFVGHIIDAVILLEINKDEIIKRLSLRGRDDDTPRAIEERLEIYNQKMKPVVDYFVSKGIKLLKIDGVGSVEQVHQRIIEGLL
jgi:adenylate kinase